MIVFRAILKMLSAVAVVFAVANQIMGFGNDGDTIIFLLYAILLLLQSEVNLDK